MAHKNQDAYYMASNQGRGEYSERDELLHPEAKQYQPGDTLTETQYFGFNIPEENIHGMVYLWCHPNLGVVTGGVWAFQGIKKHQLACELFDWRNHMSEAALANDLHDYTLDNNIRVQMIVPGEKFRLQYADEKRGNRIDIEFNAVMPPFMFSSNRHFEQTMKTQGELVLRGKRYPVNGYCVRDRSWGQLRLEHHESMPPMTWMGGAFNDDFSFCCSAFDHPALDPEWKGMLDIPGGKAFVGGYVRNNGETLELVDCQKRTTHNPESLFPEFIVMDITDSKGGHYHLEGTVIASCPMGPWSHVTIPVCLTRWECNGLIGYGDAQDVQWGDYVYMNRK